MASLTTDADSKVVCYAPGCQRTDTRVVYLADPNDALVLCPDHEEWRP